MKSSALIISNRSRNNENTNSLLFSTSSSFNKITQDKNNDECIQLIVDDINQIVEKYTRELDDAIHAKTTIRSTSIDCLPEKQSSSSYRHNSIDTLYESNISKLMKSTITKTTINIGQEIIDKKESSKIFNETDYLINSPKGDFQTQKLTIIHHKKANNGDDEPPQIIVNSRFNQINLLENENILNDPPPLPPKRKIGW